MLLNDFINLFENVKDEEITNQNATKQKELKTYSSQNNFYMICEDCINLNEPLECIEILFKLSLENNDEVIYNLFNELSLKSILLSVCDKIDESIYYIVYSQNMKRSFGCCTKKTNMYKLCKNASRSKIEKSVDNLKETLKEMDVKTKYIEEEANKLSMFLDLNEKMIKYNSKVKSLSKAEKKGTKEILELLKTLHMLHKKYFTMKNEFDLETYFYNDGTRYAVKALLDEILKCLARNAKKKEDKILLEEYLKTEMALEELNVTFNEMLGYNNNYNV